MRFHDLRADAVFKRLPGLLGFDDARPFAFELGHGGCAADDAKTVVDEPDEVVEVAVAVLGVAEPFPHSLYIALVGFTHVL